MYHYDPQTALEELQEDAMLPSPVHIRDMMIRSKLQPGQSLELNREFQAYLRAFGEAQDSAELILQQLAGQVESVRSAPKP